MADSESYKLLFSDRKATPEEQEIIPPLPQIPPLPDIQALLSRVKRQVDKAKTLEVKTGYLDIGIEELKQIKVDGWRQYDTITEQHALNDPQPFWDYDSDLDKAVNELGILRQSLLLADTDRTASVKAPAPTPSTALVSAVPAAVIPAPPDPKVSSPDVMDVDELAAYLKVSSSLIYKTYKSEGIPYFLLGTLLRFQKEEVDIWISKRGKAGLSVTSITGPRPGISASTSPPPLPVAPRNTTKPSDQPIELLDERVHPQTLARINKLIALLWEKDCLSQNDSQRFKDWMLRRARLSPNEAKIVWLRQRKSLVTCIVLCHYAELVDIPETLGKKQPRPDFGATIERDFIAEGKSALQNIDRDCAKDIDGEINAFNEYMRAYARRNELDFPEDNILFSALAEYYDDIDGSEGMAVEIGEIKDLTQNVDYLMMKLFHALSATEGS